MKENNSKSKENNNIFWGRNREKRKPIDGYRSLCSTNFYIFRFLKMYKKSKEYIKSEKGYVVFDKAFDMYGKPLLFYMSISVYIKTEYVNTVEDTYNEFSKMIDHLIS